VADDVPQSIFAEIGPKRFVRWVKLGEDRQPTDCDRAGVDQAMGRGTWLSRPPSKGRCPSAREVLMWHWRRKDALSLCLVSVTTSDRWELASIRKCLACDYQLVVLVAPDTKHLGKLRSSIEPELAEKEGTRVRFFLPDELFAYVQELELKDLDQERTVRGIQSEDQLPGRGRGPKAASGENVISQVVAKSIKRGRQTKNRDGRRCLDPRGAGQVGSA